MLEHIGQIFRPQAEGSLPPVQQVDADIERLAGREAALVAERAAKQQQLAITEERTGEEYLDGHGESITNLAHLRLELEAIDLALTAARKRRLELVRSRYQLRAADLRLRAGEKQAELDTLNNQTEKLLRKLSELEGVNYDHSILSAQRCGDWFGPDFRPPQEWMGPADVAPDPVTGRYQMPRSRRLREEIEALLSEAAKIEADADQAVLEEGAR